MSIKTASDLFNEVLNNGGFTVNPRTQRLAGNNGYVVATSGSQEIFDSESFTPEAIESYYRRHVETYYKNRNLFIGGWWNPRNQKIYLDIVELIDSKTVAIRKGMLQDQESIYDQSNYKIIYLPSRQKSGTFAQQETYLRMKIRELCS